MITESAFELGDITEKLPEPPLCEQHLLKMLPQCPRAVRNDGELALSAAKSRNGLTMGGNVVERAAKLKEFLVG